MFVLNNKQPLKKKHNYSTIEANYKKTNNWKKLLEKIEKCSEYHMERIAIGAYTHSHNSLKLKRKKAK